MIACASVALGGCAGTNLPASVKGGECRVFEAPPYVVRGVKKYDQAWIDETIEAGVGGCNWRRPKTRPAAIDASRTVAAPPAKKPGIVQRLKERVGLWPPVTAMPPAQPAPAAPSPPAPPPDPLEDLLGK